MAERPGGARAGCAREPARLPRERAGAAGGRARRARRSSRRSSRQAAAAIEQAPETPLVDADGHLLCGRRPRRRAASRFLFPGQGSQYVGMGADLAMVLRRRARRLGPGRGARASTGVGVHQVVFPAPGLHRRGARRTGARARPRPSGPSRRSGVQSLALLRVLSRARRRARTAWPATASARSRRCTRRGRSTRPTLVAGRAAARRADARGRLDPRRDARRGAVHRRGAPLSSRRRDGEVVVANHNAPTQVVLSGATEAIARVEEALAATGDAGEAADGGDRVPQPAGGAGSSAPLPRATCAASTSPRREIDVYGYADAMPYPRDPEAVRRRLAAQLAQPVRFVEQIEAMYASGVRTFVEVGAGSRAHRAGRSDPRGTRAPRDPPGSQGSATASPASSTRSADWRSRASR